MKKYYQVFVSSVTNEFEKIRPKILNELIGQDKFFPVAMEYMTSDVDTIEMLYSYMRNSDIYVLLLGEQSGTSINEKGADSLDKICLKEDKIREVRDSYIRETCIHHAKELTYTEVEYIFANAMKLKCSIFVKKEIIKSLESEKFSRGNNRLYNISRQQMTYKSFKDEEQLLSAINNTINKFATDLLTEKAGWIRETDSMIYQSTNRAGIDDVLLDGIVDKKELENKLKMASKLKLLYTTGARFVQNNEEILIDFVANGGDVEFLCTKPYSKVLTDVQKIEEMYIHTSRDKIHEEFNDVFFCFKSIYMRAAEKNKDNEKCAMGSIKIGFSSTLFRSSVLICENDISNKYWGCMTVTLPPYKSKDTISFVMSDMGTLRETALIQRAKGHFDAIWNYACKNNEMIIINEDVKFPEFLSEADNISNYWRQKEVSAKLNMRRKHKFERVLIEVAAQHPLDDGEKPGSEFAARLDVAYMIYKQNIEKNIKTTIYVPGSIHLDKEGVPDEISLSEAGCNYLENKGISKDDLIGNELNEKDYKDRYYKGVYNTADECYVAATFFKNDNNEFKELISICSPNQLMRKTLFYLENEIIPKIITVPTERMSHNFLHELLTAVPYVLNYDHNWQEKGSKEAIRTRRERMEGFSE